ncbi:YidC/Oxa1 family membrane protein insertase [Ruminococcus albus]|uniref:Membrane protein insertase, YidC/Oxa1 family n=1 Tax=Ruminococcus albus (strain ATCC 27210 / DSM 20455 / JCM 14654 / NCDO 2250 / 7) TaxID=697329 RepID=E6UGS9_RUMA7|nr:YidC/Oxa1 family membrane protein insertase [Ruminococcus albus]ADU23741.1 membrane protein insertase, YidC/Oxa1 family [Ruminococcus albus 7 = DSM 20455]
MFDLIAIPLGWIMKGCYYVFKNYGIALLVFTLITKLIVFPLSVKQEKSMASIAMLKPKLDELEKKYGKNKQKLQEEQMALYSETGVNPMASCLPILVMMLILFAMIPVIYGPLTYVSSLDKDEVKASNQMIKQLHIVSAEVKAHDTTLAELIEGYEADGKDPYEELEGLFKDEDEYPKSAKSFKKENGVDNVIDAIKLHNDIDTFILDEKYFSQNLIEGRPELMTFVFAQDKSSEYSDVLSIASNDVEKFSEDFNYEFMGIYLGTTPSWKDNKLSCLVPILSFLLNLLTTIISQYYTKKNNPSAAKMTGSNNAVMYIMPLFSLWITFKYPIGLGIYWCFSSLFSIIQMIILKKIYTPEHVAELVEKDMAKKKTSGRQNLMQKMAEAQLVAAGKDPAEIRKQVGGSEYEEPKKKSKNEIKQEQRKKINEARQKAAEEMDEEEKELTDEQREKLRKAREKMARKYGN